MIVRKTASEIEKMRVAGRVVAEVHQAIANAIVPGVTRTIDLDRLAVQIARKHNAVPAFFNYRGYPANTCISVNAMVVHGIPGDLVLKSGDIVSVDFACSVDGYFADAAITHPVGEISVEAKRLLAVTRECLFKGIAQARMGGRLGDVSSAIQKHAERNGYGVVRELVGHGVGKQMHEDPQVANYGKPGKGELLVEGMTLAIEPMINQGTYKVDHKPDGWTVVTADGKLSAHFEHTVAIRRQGPDILTLPGAVGVESAAVSAQPVAVAA